MSLVEVMIAIVLLTIGLLAVISLQPAGYILSARSDQLGRAAAILREELETQEARIMNSCNAVATGTTTEPVVYSSGSSSPETGDVPYSVVTNITSTGTNIWRVRVTVTGTNSTITESLIVTRQEYHRQGSCPP